MLVVEAGVMWTVLLLDTCDSFRMESRVLVSPAECHALKRHGIIMGQFREERKE